MQVNELITQLKSDLTDGRFLHSIGVAECARKLAHRFGVDAEKAYVAGLLHDCATKLSAAQMSALAVNVGLCTAEYVSDNPVAEFHSRLGAYVAKHDYGVDDADVLQAIAYHQIGAVPMTMLDITVSLADGIEPSRRGEDIDGIRQTAERDLIKAYAQKCELYISNIKAAGNVPSRQRIDVYEYILTLL